MYSRYENVYHYIVTSGQGHLDIDALACGVGMVDFLNKIGCTAQFISQSPFNATIPPYIRNLNINVSSPYTSSLLPWFIICDVSDPKYFDLCVDHKRVYEVIDHHFGFEKYWQNKNTIYSDIQPVAACASLIAQKFINWDIKPEESTAMLLGTAILSNSLGLKLRLTKEEDHQAFRFLQNSCFFAKDYKEKFFLSCQDFFTSNPLPNLNLDTKEVTIKGDRYIIGQIEAWDLSDFPIKNLYRDFTQYWSENETILNVAMVGKECNYIFFESEKIRNMLSSLYSGKFDDNCFITDNLLLLRKELVWDLDKLTKNF